jgi:formylglycine-generating enzyme required for sulfatase activity
VPVSTAAPFSVGKFAGTFDEWDACVGVGGCNGYKPDDDGWGRIRHPVTNVNWDDAKAFASSGASARSSHRPRQANGY